MRTPKLLLAAALLSGSMLFILAVILSQPPVWLAKYELVLFAFAALAYGFTGCLPPILKWLRCRPIRGVVYLVIGAVAMHLPSNLVISCLFLGAGIRLIWQTANDLALEDSSDGWQRVCLVGDGREIARRGTGTEVMR